MFCGQCGTERASENARFCRSCGADFAASVPSSFTAQRDDPGGVKAAAPVVPEAADQRDHSPVRLDEVDPMTTAQFTPPSSVPVGRRTTAAPAAASASPPHPVQQSYPADNAWNPSPSPPESSRAAWERRLPLFAAAFVLLVVGGLIGYIAVTRFMPV